MSDEPEDPVLEWSRRALVGEPAPKVEVVLVEYDPMWPQRFEVEKQRITAALGERALMVEHIGSTSVAGLAAKPIIDILLTVADSVDEASYLGDLEAAGYELRVREPDFPYDRTLRSSTAGVLVHVFTRGCAEITRYRVFRDWLRSNDADRALYESTKRELAQHDWPTMNHYADAKTDIIEAILARAQQRT